MPKTALCYHCGIHHPVEEIRQILTKGGKLWRCIKSIEATKFGITKRDAYSRRITAINEAEAKGKISWDRGKEMADHKNFTIATRRAGPLLRSSQPMAARQ